MSRIAPSYRETCVPSPDATGSAEAAAGPLPAADFISGSGSRFCVGQRTPRILEGSMMKRVLLAGAIGSFLFLGASFLRPVPASAWPTGLPQEAKYEETDGDPDGPDIAAPSGPIPDSEETLSLEDGDSLQVLVDCLLELVGVVISP